MAAVQQALDQASGSAEGQEAAAEAVSYAPGTYEGSAQGFGGEVKATVTIGEDGIETVELVGDDETPELGKDRPWKNLHRSLQKHSHLK